MWRHQSITGEHSKIPELLYYLLSKSHHRHPASFNSPTLHYWGVRYRACALPPSYSRLKTSASACTRCHCLWVKLWETEDLDATKECDIPFKSLCVGGNVYSCLCFHDGPETRPGNLLNWLVHYSSDDVSHLFLIPVELHLILKP